MKKSAQTSIEISVHGQELVLRRGKIAVKKFPISTSRFGLGFEEGSMKTPFGNFCVAEKIGAGEPIGAVFKSRRSIGIPRKLSATDDLIMSRILWLEGRDAANANTHARYIYLHGTNHEDEIGRPASHGCVRMRNADIVELFDLVEVNTPVKIARARRKIPQKKRARKSLRRSV